MGDGLYRYWFHKGVCSEDQLKKLRSSLREVGISANETIIGDFMIRLATEEQASKMNETCFAEVGLHPTPDEQFQEERNEIREKLERRLTKGSLPNFGHDFLKH